jgi:hypothetical protein
MSWDGIFTVLTYTPVARGGLGLAVPTIGTLFSLSAIAYIIVTPLALPRIERRLGGVRALRYIFGVWPLIALLIPLAQWAARRLRPAMWAVLAGQLVAKNAGNLAWPFVHLPPHRVGRWLTTCAQDVRRHHHGHI